MDTLLRRRMMIAVGGSPTPPPPPPTNVAYIRGGGDGSYIDTGITPDNTTKVIVWARNFQPGGGNLFGSRTSSTSNKFCLLTPGGANSGRIRIDYGDATDTYADDQFANLSHYHKYEYYQGVLKIDDVTIAATGTQPTFSGTYNLYLFGNNNAGTLQSLNFPADICACKIYKGGTLVRDFTPVESPSVGLYDAVSETVFTNAGIGTFSYGTFGSSAYTPLEYIECNGSQYFDSGVYGGYSTPIISKFRYTTNTSNVALFGYRGSSDWCEFCINYGSTVKTYFRLASDSNWKQLCSSTSSNFVGVDIVFSKGTTNTAALYKNNSQLGTSVSPTSSPSYVSSDTLFVAAIKMGGGTSFQLFTGRVYYLGIGSSRSFVPAKVNNVAGMYDTYNDVFKPSESGNAFVAGPEIERQPTHFFSGKNLAIIGDSISTYDADGYKYDSYSMYYPYGEVNSVEYTYWKKLMNDENATLEVNLSYSGSCACSRSGYVSLNDRIGLIGNADTVIIALGTNDSAQSKPLGDYLYDTPYSELGETNFREAYIKGIKGLLAAKPNLTIVCAILSMGEDYRNSIKAIAQHYNLKCIDCGNDYAKVQGVHPNVIGMQEIEKHFLYD